MRSSRQGEVQSFRGGLSIGCRLVMAGGEPRTPEVEYDDLKQDVICD